MKKKFENKKDAIFFSTVIAILLIAINIPYVYGFLHSNEKNHFFGFLWAIPDQTTYLSHMEQARQGNFLFTFLHTGENVSPKIIQPLFWIMGITSRFLPKIFVYHIFRNLLAILFAAILFLFIKFFLSEPRMQKWTWIFILFSGGFTIPIKFLEQLLPKNLALFFTVNPSLETIIPESNIFFSLYLYPHFIGGLISLLLVFYSFLKFFETKKKLWFFFACFFGFWAGFVHLYTTLIMYAVILPYVFFETFRTREWKFYLFSCFFWSVAVLLPIAYQYWVIMYDDYYGNVAKTVLSAPSLFSLFFTYGIFSFLCVFGILVAVRKKIHFDSTFQKRWIFLIFWFVFQIILVYIPLPPHRKFLEGLQIPIIIFGCAILWRVVLPFISKKISTFALLSGLFIFGLFSPFYILADDFIKISSWYRPYYIPREIYDALKVLEKNKLEGVILSNKFIGNWIPVMNANRVYQGHWAITYHPEKKKKEYAKFFSNSYEKEWKKDFLKKNNISYIFLIDDERFSPSFLLLRDDLEIKYKNSRATIYQFRRSQL